MSGDLSHSDVLASQVATSVVAWPRSAALPLAALGLGRVLNFLSNFTSLSHHLSQLGLDSGNQV